MSGRRSSDPRVPLDDIGQLISRLDTLRSRVDDLEATSPIAANQSIPKLRAQVQAVQDALNSYMNGGSYTKAQIDSMLAGKANTSHTHSGGDIFGGTLQGPMAAAGVFTVNDGLTSLDIRNRSLATNPAAVYIDANGRLGISPSVAGKKNVLSSYAVNMEKWLALPLYNYTYKDDPTATPRVGFLADDLLAAGLTEFVQYDTTGKLQGLRVDQLLYGLMSAYLQSRTTTLARLAKQSHQTYTKTSMTALSLGGTATYPVVWPVAFADNDYFVSASVYSATGILQGSAVSAVVPGSKTATGCSVQVTTTGIALGSGMTLSVEGLHV